MVSLFCGLRSQIKANGLNVCTFCSAHKMKVERIVQGDNAIVDEIVGFHIGAFSCVFGFDDETGESFPIIFLIKIQEDSNWHRFFLDAGICFWDRYENFPEHDVNSESDLFPVCEFVKGSELEGLEILAAVVMPVEWGCKVEVMFSCGFTFEASIRASTDENEVIASLAGVPLKLKQPVDLIES